MYRRQRRVSASGDGKYELSTKTWLCQKDASAQAYNPMLWTVLGDFDKNRYEIIKTYTDCHKTVWMNTILIFYPN